MQKKGLNNLGKTANLLLAAAVPAAILLFSIQKLNYDFRWETVYFYRVKLLRGFVMTLGISFFSLIFSLLLGSFFAFAARSKLLFLNYLSKIYVEIIRGTPFLVQIYFFYFIIATAFSLHNRYVLGVIILSIFSGAYVSEIIRGGIESVAASQLETARSLGFTVVQQYRYIIIPQVIRRILPALTGQFASLIKDSSLLSVIAVSELTMNTLEIDSLNFRTFENLGFLGLGYLTLTLPISLISGKLERLFSYET